MNHGSIPRTPPPQLNLREWVIIFLIILVVSCAFPKLASKKKDNFRKYSVGRSRNMFFTTESLSSNFDKLALIITVTVMF